MQQRNIPLYILLSIVTCGIFSIYWMVVLTDEVGVLKNDRSRSGAMAVVLSIVTCGIYGLYWLFVMGQDISRLKQQRFSGGAAAGGGSDLGVLYLVIGLLGLGIVSVALMQNEVNGLIGAQPPPPQTQPPAGYSDYSIPPMQ